MEHPLMKPLLILAASAMSAFALIGTASAEPLGQHVAMCAHQIGARDNAPAVTCSHDGITMTFANFGAMVEHMKLMHG